MFSCRMTSRDRVTGSMESTSFGQLSGTVLSGANSRSTVS